MIIVTNDSSTVSPIDPEEARKYYAKICSNEVLSQAEKARRIFEFLFDAELARTAHAAEANDCVRANDIARSLYGPTERGSGNSVRQLINVSLRPKLKQYYDGDGKDDPIIFKLEEQDQRGYRLTIHPRTAAGEETSNAPPDLQTAQAKLSVESHSTIQLPEASDQNVILPTLRRGWGLPRRLWIVGGLAGLAFAVIVAVRSPAFQRRLNAVHAESENSSEESGTPTPSGSTKYPLELQMFTLNEKDSLYEECRPDDSRYDCDWGYDDAKYWVPRPEAQMVLNLLAGQNMWGDTGIGVGDRRYVGFARTFRANKDAYLNRLLPTFDFTVMNHAQTSAVLTGIEVTVFDSGASEGDAGESSSASHKIPVLNRYEVGIPENYLTGAARSFHFSVPAISPIALRTNDPARFQISLSIPDGAADWRFEMGVTLRFGSRMTLTTEKFRVQF